MARKRAQLAARLNQPQRKSQRLAGNSVKVQQDERFQCCIATASLDSTVCLWDARTMSSNENTPLVTLPRQDEDSGSGSDAEAEAVEITEYERKRRENIQRNLAFMQQMGVSTAKILAQEDTVLEDDDGVEYSLADEDVTKAVQERIYSVAFLPRTDRLVVACGDKVGHVALWSPANGVNGMKQENSGSPVALFRPHNLPVGQLIFPDSAKLLSTSFDSTVKEFDLRAAEFSVVYEADDNAGITSMVTAGTPQCLYISCDDGTVRLIDRRAPKVKTSNYLLHEKKINTVHQHPTHDFLADRKPSGKSAIELPKPTRVRHNNMTGRWLTKLHASWDPKRPNQFVIGCMEHPRRVQIFRAGRHRPVRELKSDNFASVHSINVFHPHLELIAGGNSSGRLALWRGEKKEVKDEDVKNVKTEKVS
ncbi:hypothetical protein JM18_005156 [Phytophthora kernoviae]|uniref:WD repeat-containing protein 76 n=2 Tax=Phytophthora kernoviae TaxID=325452 RepID=A0A921SHJ6_9STRA|nr:hypothetical protein G195_006544 [Phytophthora kernoviae 00238/432]KAG2524302.1 hypothetical protein JM18_005156 [Phytophthora kernoviae]